MISEIANAIPPIPLDSTSIAIPVTMLWAGAVGLVFFTAVVVYHGVRVLQILADIRKEIRHGWTENDQHEFCHRMKEKNRTIIIPDLYEVRRVVREESRGH